MNNYYLYYINPNFFNNIEKKKIFIFIGYNLRLESPILNIKMRKKYLKEKVTYYIIGNNFNDNLNSKMLGLTYLNLINYLFGKLKICKKVLKELKKNNEKLFNFFLLGNNIIRRVDNKSVFEILQSYKVFNMNKCLKYINLKIKKLNDIITCKKLSFFYKKQKIEINVNYLNLNISDLLYDELNLNNVHNINKIVKNDLIYLLGLDNLLNIEIQKNKFIIFQGHHINLE